jgi:DNA-binding MarR family transcriptional regulator
MYQYADTIVVSILICQGAKMNKMSEELGYLVKQVQHELRKKMDNALLSIELSTPQYAVLTELQEFPGLSNADLARKSFVTPQTMNLIVKNLESRNIVTRTKSETHGKRIDTHITEEGLSLLEKANGIVSSIGDEVFGCLSKDEAQVLSTLLKKLVNKAL